MTAQAQKLLPDLEKGCYTYLEKTLDAYKITGIVKGNPFLIPAWRKLISENDPENFTKPSSAPLLVPQGGTDTQIPVASTKLLFTHLCKIGQDTERWIYPGQSHAGVIQYYMGDMVHWLDDRFAGDPNPDPTSPWASPASPRQSARTDRRPGRPDRRLACGQGAAFDLRHSGVAPGSRCRRRTTRA